MERHDLINLARGYIGIAIFTIVHILMEEGICIPLFCKIVELG